MARASRSPIRASASKTKSRSWPPNSAARRWSSATSRTTRRFGRCTTSSPSDFGTIDALVHSIAFANKEDLAGKVYETSRSGFSVALDVSAYSLIALVQALRDRFNDGASIIALTYLGATRIVPNYNLMGIAKAALEAAIRYLAFDLGERGIRVNAISAGPIKTASARQVGGFSRILDVVPKVAPLRRNVTAEDIGNVAVFLASDLASAITADVHFVDAGYPRDGSLPAELRRGREESIRSSLQTAARSRFASFARRGKWGLAASRSTPRPIARRCTSRWPTKPIDWDRPLRLAAISTASV